MSDILLVGRGPSCHTVDWPEDMPVMAVSSGIYAIPESKRHRIRHMATLDAPKYFMHGLHAPEMEHAWQNDPTVSRWRFWDDARVQIHTQDVRVEATGTFRELPEQIWDVIPDHARAAFQRELSRNLHLFGFQPSWGDCANVRGWKNEFYGPDPAWIDFSEGDHPVVRGNTNNSMVFAVQIAHRMGYERLHFVGCDFANSDPACFGNLIALLSDWYQMACEQGKEWINHSPDSLLRIAFNQEIHDGRNGRDREGTTADEDSVPASV